MYDHENPVYWKAVADCEFHVGNTVSSLDAYEEACLLDPEDKEVWLNWSYIYYEQGEYEKAIELLLDGLDELPDEPRFFYRLTAYLISAGKYKEAFNYLENALILDFDGHTELYEFFPKLETQKALFRIIEQFRKDHH
jgi:tetratricopeptide (TPR) repeat protein